MLRFTVPCPTRPLDHATDLCPGLPTNAPDAEVRDGEEAAFVESLEGRLTLRGRAPSADLLVLVDEERLWECVAELSVTGEAA